jgi:hypothetical protein
MSGVLRWLSREASNISRVPPSRAMAGFVAGLHRATSEGCRGSRSGAGVTASSASVSSPFLGLPVRRAGEAALSRLRRGESCSRMTGERGSGERRSGNAEPQKLKLSRVGSWGRRGALSSRTRLGGGGHLAHERQGSAYPPMDARPIREDLRRLIVTRCTGASRRQRLRERHLCRCAETWPEACFQGARPM